MERVHLIKKVYPDSTRLCYLFWSEFTGTSIEYRYNYLFTHKSHTAALRSGSHAAGMCLIRQLAVLDCKSTNFICISLYEKGKNRKKNTK